VEIFFQKHEVPDLDRREAKTLFLHILFYFWKKGLFFRSAFLPLKGGGWELAQRSENACFWRFSQSEAREQAVVGVVACGGNHRYGGEQ
jgi:hypothetical protein